MSFLANLSRVFKAPSPAKGRKKRPTRKRKAKVYPRQKVLISHKQVEEAKARTREIILEAKNEAFKIKTKASNQVRKLENEAFQIKEKISQQQAAINGKLVAFEEREKLLLERDKKFQNNSNFIFTRSHFEELVFKV